MQHGLGGGGGVPRGRRRPALALRYNLATRLPVGRLFYFDGRGPWALDAVLEHDAVPVGSEARLYRSLVGRASLNIPLGGEQSYTWLWPGLKARRIDYAERTVDVGGELELLSDTEFRQLGFSFALHLELDGVTYLLGREAPNAARAVGGAESFPFSLRSSLLLYGYPPNAIATSQAMVATAHCTFPIAELDRGLGALPTSFQRTSGAIRLQAAAIDSSARSACP